MREGEDIFTQINNAVLDLQAADLQSYTLPLKRLGRLLQHSELKPYNDQLIADLDLEAFITAGENTRQGMVGSAHLDWPDDDREVLGLQLLLILRFCDDPNYMELFGHTFYYSSNKIINDIRAVTSQVIVPFARDYKNYVLRQGDTSAQVIRYLSNKVFIVHGYDGEARETVARFLGNIGFDPVILHEQASRGRTVIEKVEANSEVDFAVVLLTPDDLGKVRNDLELEPRARQNVLLELGYCMGRLGRERVCALMKDRVEIPSDFGGVVWERMDENGGWKQTLARELQAAGHIIYWNKVMR